jgi:hypothetical protein
MDANSEDKRHSGPQASTTALPLPGRGNAKRLDQTFLHPQAKSDSTTNEATTKLTYNKSCIFSFSGSQICRLYKPSSLWGRRDYSNISNNSLAANRSRRSAVSPFRGCEARDKASALPRVWLQSNKPDFKSWRISRDEYMATSWRRTY